MNQECERAIKSLCRVGNLRKVLAPHGVTRDWMPQQQSCYRGCMCLTGASTGRWVVRKRRALSASTAVTWSPVYPRPARIGASRPRSAIEVSSRGVWLEPKPPSRSLLTATLVGIAGELADVVDMVGQVGHRHLIGTGLAAHPAGMEHPGIAGHRHDAAAGEHQAQLLVGELAPAGHQGAAVLVAGQQRAGVAVERLQEGAVGEVGDVQDQTLPPRTRPAAPAPPRSPPPSVPVPPA